MPKKYGVTIQKMADGFIARVVRRRTSRGMTVEREKGGFPDHAAAVAWGEVELAGYLADRQIRNDCRKKDRREARERRRERAAWLAAQTLRELAELSGSHPDAADLLKDCADILWSEVAFRALKRGETEDAAVTLADTVVGKNLTQRLAKAVSGDLDHVHEAVTDMALANAARLAQDRLAGEGRHT
ncbi:MAG: hypothetical protein K0S94_2907 [Nitrospira sp.]|nr:hypothetical protein [Nitrospira sp.]